MTSLLSLGCPRPTRVYPEVGAVVPELVGRTGRGEDFKLSALQRKARFIFFGYTYCPDVCPLTLLTLRKALKDTNADPSEVAVIFVSVDPERDDEATLGKYVEAFGPAAMAVKPNNLTQVIKDFGLVVEREGAKSSTGATDHYTINHTASVTLIDAIGTVRARFAHGTPPAEITPYLQELLTK
ncbi:MAG: SCO family protein [Deltaproteobacteria bacterium]|nr:SCO family protein [Deltaproteobacteria bacterium]